MSENALLAGLDADLPAFADIKPEHVLPALEQVLAENRERLAALIGQRTPTWCSLIEPLEALDERVQRVWGPVNHLNAVCDSEEMRAAHQQGVAKITAYHSELAQHKGLYEQICKLHQRADFQDLPVARKRLVEHALRGFRLGGVALPHRKQQRFQQIQIRLSELATAFEQNVLDATRAFEMHIEDEGQLAGLPASVRAAARERAVQAGKTGWLFTLDAPSYVPFMEYAEVRELRRQLYTAYATRASSGELDNTPLIGEILGLRHEAAKLLGFGHFADYSLETKMAKSTAQVMGFLHELAEKSRPMAERELAELSAFAADELGIGTLEAWDIPFASERLRQKLYDFSQEELKAYFPEPQVLAGLFALVRELYGLRVVERHGAPRWHEDVRLFDLVDSSDGWIASFYLDPYARPHKRGGAWMDECIVRWRRPDGHLQRPVAYLVCNFAAPIGEEPALWTFDEVTTLFHEFGHGLHHMLTQAEELGISGIRGVPWDAVELPSQFMENFCWERDVLDLFARHYQTDAPLPEALFSKFKAARNFQAGMKMLRQIEFALFDFTLHSSFEPGGATSVHQILDEVRDEVAVFKPPPFNRFECAFSHIFGGGYAAGYYSYKWAEVLAADAYAAFEENGIFDADTAQSFLVNILAVGGGRDMLEAFAAFRGREPTVEALLRQSGITG